MNKRLSEMTQEDSDYAITEAMLKYGGSFVKQLAKCYRAADRINQRRLILAFPEYFEEYMKLAETDRHHD